MKEYKLVAGKIERFKYADYVKARIFLEIQEFEKDVDIDALVEAGYKVWENSERMSPEDIGGALWAAIQYLDETEPMQMIYKGIDFIR